MPVKNILIADDETSIRKILVRLLKPEGYRFFEASNGKDAIEVVRKNPIDLAILDMVMPEMDGVEALKRIKEMDQTIAVLMITGHAELDSLREVIFDYGVFDYLLKPFFNTEIKLTVKRALHNRELALKNTFLENELENRILELERDFKEKTFSLRSSQIKYRNIVENSTDAIVVAQDGYLKFANSRAAELTGYSREEILKIRFDEMIHPDDRPGTVERYRNRLDGKDLFPMASFRVMRKDGSFFWAENHAAKTSWGEDPAVLNVIRDISERMKTEASLRIRDAALASSLSGICLADLEGELTYVNTAFLKMWGYSGEEEIVGKPLLSLMRNETAGGEIIDKLRDRGGWISEITGVRKDGSFFDAQGSASMVMDASDKPICLMGSFFDITKQKKAEESMMRTEKLSSLGQLSAGLAHELRNPLAVVSSCSQFCLENMKLERLVRENFEVIYRNSQRASKLISELLAFASTDRLERKEVDINDVLMSVLQMTRLEVDPSHVSFVRRLKTGLPEIMGDKEKLGQVFLNLIQNAIHAVSGVGTIILETRLLDTDGMVEVSIIDNGSGIPEEYRGKIFDPFFTTKDGGTGLGLSICNSIIEQHQGGIRIKCGEDGGTRVSVTLPGK